MDRETQTRLISEIDGYLATHTTSMAPSEVVHPVAEYHRQDIFDLERERLFRTCPLVVGHTSQLPNPRNFITDDLTGVPLLIVRQEDGSLRAMANICRHRGARLCSELSGSHRVFTCAYHAWSYRPDGSLRAVPFEETFGTVDPPGHGLIQLPVEERHGLIWVVLTPGAPIDVASYLGPADAELAGYGLDDYVVERQTVLREDINWKVVVDGFLETYHLRFLHPKTVGPYVHTNLAPFEALDDHLRIVGVRMTYEDARGDADPDSFPVMSHITPQYVLFPNTVAIHQQDHFEIWTSFPDGVPGKSATRVSLLAPRSTAAKSDRWDKNWRIAMNTVLQEDFVVGRTVQQAYGSGAITEVLFGRNEPALQHFHTVLADARAGAPGTGRPVAVRANGRR